MNSGKVILITGGARSGKSSFAERLLEDNDDVLYIATSIVADNEMKDRVKKHRERRNVNWDTVEKYKDLDKALEENGKKYILLDCVTIMTTNIMFSEAKDFDHISMEKVDEITLKIKKEFGKLIRKVREQNKIIVMVTNEVGLGLVPSYRLGRIFRDIAGFINQYIGDLSDEVYLVCCGQGLKIK